ncbi:Uncharacterized membrane protein YgdD, TMEM256/DUF423 family [Allopseudospirillum japonicum]|uniref:Uncharacterized membrane protein YgdD, TMEM256/DUF423 family n=1 Tax=Allopseudospirillum japonicum TaxID=64971 RepID=A0A1H6RJM5_9GAMM|nr:DUF423 domain-containing protein [Allopseudospirillum japonicum]SEI56008.1 Uncharacterized membrane protein YgdD, TMEM256/DUF423 family [Allopseudospirillum japonicum]
MRISAWMSVSACSGALGVALGAFAAHGLKNTLTPYLLEVFQTGVEYQMLHTLALAWVCVWMHRDPDNPWWSSVAWAWTLGMMFFSGSLYLLALTGIHYLGFITPIGGSLLILGWLLILVAIYKHNHQQSA